MSPSLPAPSLPSAPRRLPIEPYPALVGVAFILSIVQGNDVPVAGAIRPLAIAIAVGLGGAFLGRLLAGDRDRGALIGLLAVVLVARGADWRFVALPLAAAVVVVAEGRLARRRDRSLIPWPGITRVGNVLSALMVAVFAAQFALGAAGPATARDDRWEAAAASPSAARPDIYLVLLDGHGRLDVLEADFGLDASGFAGDLADLGFDVAPASRANYMMTRFTLASMLNGAHLADLGVDLGTAAFDPLVARASRDSAAFRLLERSGYRTVVLSSGWEHTAVRNADDFRDLGLLNELENVFLYNSALLGPVFALEPDFTGVEVRDRFERTLAALVEVAGTPSAASAREPRFTLAHLPVPHFPEVYRADCSPRPVGQRAAPEVGEVAPVSTGDGLAARIELQVTQTECVDRTVIPALEAIVAADPDAVVILFSDHGPQTLLSYEAPDERGIRTRLANLFAARTPGHPDLFPDDVTLVNVLPILFNAYLGTDLPLQPDDVFFGPDPAGALRLVTDLR